MFRYHSGQILRVYLDRHPCSTSIRVLHGYRSICAVANASTVGVVVSSRPVSQSESRAVVSMSYHASLIDSAVVRRIARPPLNTRGQPQSKRPMTASPDMYGRTTCPYAGPHSGQSVRSPSEGSSQGGSSTPAINAPSSDSATFQGAFDPGPSFGPKVACPCKRRLYRQSSDAAGNRYLGTW